MHTVRTLEGVTSPELYEVYKESFCDYPVDLGFDERRLCAVLNRLGGDASHSFGAFEDGKLIGFASCGLRQFKGMPTGYVALTGVSIHHRRKGVGKAMMEAFIDHFKNLGVKRLLLEVIENNTPAYGLYKKVGLETSRSFCSYSLEAKADTKQYDMDIRLVKAEDAPWETLSSFWDFPPCWQNSIDTIMSNPSIELIAIAYENGTPTGYAACSRYACSIDHLAVRKDKRRCGIGSALLAYIAEATPSNGMTLLNIDQSCKPLIAFAQKHGFDPTLSLHELEMEI